MWVQTIANIQKEQLLEKRKRETGWKCKGGAHVEEGPTWGCEQPQNASPILCLWGHLKLLFLVI